MRQLQLTYNLFENYIATYTQYVEGAKTLLYRQEKGIEVLYNHIRAFFLEKTYGAETFHRYVKLFTEDSNYLTTLFPTYTIKESLLETYNHTLFFSLERKQNTIQKILDISTLGLRRILIR